VARSLTVGPEPVGIIEKLGSAVTGFPDAVAGCGSAASRATHSDILTVRERLPVCAAHDRN
jgi:hypothetical protein